MLKVIAEHEHYLLMFDGQRFRSGIAC